MGTVSENMIVGIRLGPSITCESICQNIQKLIDKYNNEKKDLSNSILVIRVVDVVEDNEMIPKLT